MVTGKSVAAGAFAVGRGRRRCSRGRFPPQATPPITTPPAVSAPTWLRARSHTGQLTRRRIRGAPPASTGNYRAGRATVVTAGPVAAPAAPVVGGSAVPAGPPPAYGSDLRPQPLPYPFGSYGAPYPARRWRPRRHRPHRRVGALVSLRSAQPRKLWLDRLVRARDNGRRLGIRRPPPARRRARIGSGG